MNRVLVRILQALLPLVILAVAGFGALTMIWNRTPVETLMPVVAPPGVRVHEVALVDAPLTVISQGTVRPRTESQLVAEIDGRVIWVAPSFAQGGFFEAGDVLVRVDPFDYEQALVSARSQLAQAHLRLAEEEAEAEIAQREWETLGRGDPRELALRKPQLEDARAAIAAAEAAVERAERDLERADIPAAYAGRVRTKDVDIGQYVRRGDTLATVYAVDIAEIRLPLPDGELAYLDLPMSYRGAERQAQPDVTLRATFAGEAHVWTGRIVRTESEIDEVSRMVHAVAEVADPYAQGSNPNRPPLAVGMYVEAEIGGRTARGVAVLPREALRGRDQVLVVLPDDRLEFRSVDVLRASAESVIVEAGLQPGELVVVSPLDTPTDGMLVQLADADPELLARRRDAATAAPTGPAPEMPAGENSAVAEAAPDAGVPAVEPATPAANRVPATIPPTEGTNPEEAVAADLPAWLEDFLEEAESLPGNAPATGTASETAPGTQVASTNPAAIGAGPDTEIAPTAPPERRRRPGIAPAGRGGTPPRRGMAPAARTEPPRGRRPPGRMRNALSVLPFDDLSAGGERTPDVDLGVALTEAVTERLASLPGIGVVAGDDGATWVVGGGIQRMGSMLRVTARLTDARNGAVISAVKLDGTVEALADLQDRVAAAMVEQVRDAIASEAGQAGGRGADAGTTDLKGRQS